MAKRIHGPGGECVDCHNRHDLVLTLPSNQRKPATLAYGLHDQLGGGKCSQSGRTVPSRLWPSWATRAFDEWLS